MRRRNSLFFVTGQSKAFASHGTGTGVRVFAEALPRAGSFGGFASIPPSGEGVISSSNAMIRISSFFYFGSEQSEAFASHGTGTGVRVLAKALPRAGCFLGLRSIDLSGKGDISPPNAIFIF